MDVTVSCPNCGKASVVPFDKLPNGRLKTTCNGCGAKFTVDKDARLNCSIGEKYDAAGWQVDAPGCAGMTYDQEAVAGLVLRGMVTRETLVTPPEAYPMPAEEIEQLRKAFEMWDKKNPNG